MKEKYIDLLLKKCIDLNKSKSLFINYDIINQDFIDKLVKRAKELGINDIYLDKEDIYKEHNILKNIKLSDIEFHNYFNRSIWNDYALKGSNFLIFKTSIPGVMDDIESEKIARALFIKLRTSDIYKKKQTTYQIPWCIASLPNEIWAKDVFKNKKNALELLEDSIYKACMVNMDNPIESWDIHLENNRIMINKLNNLKIKLLHYKNKLGTDLKVGLLKESVWCDASTNGIVNMPSYEIFTSPDYRKTNGIVYSSRPLVYNGGLIDKFWIKFENGKAIDCGALKGEEILKNIIKSDSNACYLGECALVENNSPISSNNIIYGITLLDENASCHLALGCSISKCYNNNEDLNSEELLKKGLNISKVHVDFMIGTSDMDIEAETYDGNKIKILENGNFKK